MIQHFSVGIIKFARWSPAEARSRQPRKGHSHEVDVNRRVARVVMIVASLAAFVVAVRRRHALGL